VLEESGLPYTLQPLNIGAGDQFKPAIMAISPNALRNPANLDPFSAEIMRNYLLSTVKEMATTTVRTAYSACFSEGEDFTCGRFDRHGNMIAQAAGINVHAGGLT
jgi:hypothetical protein